MLLHIIIRELHFSARPSGNLGCLSLSGCFFLISPDLVCSILVTSKSLCFLGRDFRLTSELDRNLTLKDFPARELGDGLLSLLGS